MVKKLLFIVALCFIAAASLPESSDDFPLQFTSIGDKDNDGIKNRDDNCPNEPEDLDHFQDSDGCPDPDNDNDGVLDALDKCSREPEDKDGFEDGDGCPDLDNDRDRIPDNLDRCMNESEDFDGYEDSDGCPDLDNDSDGVPDLTDKCPMDAEDRDGTEDDDGCPDIDNDHDGIPDSQDRCPDKAENRNNFQDEDGCPDEAVQQIPMGQRLLEGLLFEGRTAEIDFTTRYVLDSLSRSLLTYPETVLEVIGNVDKSENPDQDYELALEMAQSVCSYLISTGVEAERLTAQSVGSSRPTSSNVTPEGRRENRRIEIRRIQ
jgi:outer membrane protein OmpA-like peptidoglycan-associated protein